MGKRYGKLPSDILALPVDEFTLNRLVMLMGMKYEASATRGHPMTLTGPDDDLPSKLDAIFSRVAGGKKRRKRK